MPTTNALPGPLQWLGIAKEVTPGTPVTPAYFMSPKTITAKDDPKKVDIDALRGSMGTVFNVIPTIIVGSVESDGYFYPDTDGFPLAGILGDIVETGSAAPYTHTFSLLNSAPGQPHAYTLTHSWGATEARQRAFGIWDSVNLKFTASGVLMSTSSATTFGSVQVATVIPVISAASPIAAWLGTATIGGTAEYTVFDGNLTIKREATPIEVLNGTQTPGSIFGGTVTVTGKLSFVVDAADTVQVQFLNDTQQSLVLNFTQGTGATEESLNLQMTLVDFKTYQLKEEKSFMAADVDFTAILNSTDAGASGGESPIQATLINAIPTGVY